LAVVLRAKLIFRVRRFAAQYSPSPRIETVASERPLKVCAVIAELPKVFARANNLRFYRCLMAPASSSMAGGLARASNTAPGHQMQMSKAKIPSLERN